MLKEFDVIALCDAALSFRKAVNEFWLLHHSVARIGELPVEIDLVEEQLTESFSALERAEHRIRRQLMYYSS